MEIIEKVIKVNRCTTVTKGGRKFSFSVVIVLGNRKGSIGYGFGKANDVINAKQKAFNQAKKNIFTVSLKNGRTIPHKIISKFCSSKIIIKPASLGRGIVAGVTAKSLFDVLGVKDIVVKSINSNNSHNLIKAIILGLKNITKNSARII